MKLPNDLIKATDYSKAKNREIHEFEFVNGKYIHKYVLGGEHEMMPQEIVDCLNAIATIDCDLSTAYAYIKGQNEKIADLEAKLAESEKQIKDAREAGNMAVDSWCKNRRKYEAQIAEMQNKSFILYSMLYETLEKQGCDNVASQIDQMTGWTYDKEVNWLKGNRNYEQLKQSQKQLAIEELEKLKDFFLEPYKDEEMDTDYIITKDAGEIADYILDQIKQLKEGK